MKIDTTMERNSMKPRWPKVLCMLNLERCPQAVKALEAVAEVTVLPVDRALLLQEIPPYDAYFGNMDIVIDKEIIDRAVNLQVIASPSTGTDHLDRELLKQRKIQLLSLTKEYEFLDRLTATAECAWGLLLACVREIPAAQAAVHRGEWARERFCGHQLAGKTLGVLGVGRLGKMVAEYGKAFRMRVLGCDLRKFSIPGVRRVDFDTLLKEADVISIHIHLNDANRGLISAEAFRKMKDGVVIVNTSRGAIIDETAFRQALASGTVSAAGIDVINGEWAKEIRAHPLVSYARQNNNLVITPHIGGATEESIVWAREFMAAKLAAYLQANCQRKDNHAQSRC